MVDPRLLAAIQQTYDDFSRGAFDAALTHLHPAIEWRVYGRDEPGVYRGHDGVKQFFQDFRDAWESISAEVEEVRDLGDGRLLVLLRWHATARASGMELDHPVGHVVRLQDGMVIEMDGYMDREQALAAAGTD